MEQRARVVDGADALVFRHRSYGIEREEINRGQPLLFKMRNKFPSHSHTLLQMGLRGAVHP